VVGGGFAYRADLLAWSSRPVRTDTPPLMRHHPVCACARHTVLSGPRYIPDSLHVPLPSYPLCSHPILYPSLHPPLGGTRTAASRGPSPNPDDRRQNQTTVARTRQPLPGLDDDLSNNQPANTTNDSIDRSIELNQSFDIGPSPNRIKAS
jgi:hypothetical protein